MKYLFFDIESPDGGIGAICEYGYVLADDHFNIIEQKVITINPQRPFNTGYRKGRPNVKFYFPKEVYLKSPTFPFYYEQIKKLMTDPDTIILGYSVNNDIRYIAFTSNRYHVPVFDYKAYDVQIMYKELTNSINLASLDKVVEEIPLEERKGLVSHRSDCDAKMTMLVFKYLLNKYNLSIDNLLKNNYKIEVIKYLHKLEENRRIKQERKIAFEAWDKFCLLGIDSNQKGCVLSGEIKKNVNDTNRVIELITKANLKGVVGISNSDYFIVKDLTDKERLMKVLHEPYQGKFITLLELENFKE